MTTMTQTNTTEMELLTDTIVIFGATGDLCKRKLIPALYRLWDKETRKKMDKDRFRQGLGSVVETYIEVADRLGLKL